MRDICQRRTALVSLLTAGLLVLTAGTASGQTVTGQWDFNDPYDGFAATVGSDGYFWTRPEGGQSDEVEFGTASSFGIPLMPGGDGGVMKLPAFDEYNGIALWHGMSYNGGGWYVNQYTIIYDVLYPEESDGLWRSLWQTNDCNWNDGDFFVHPNGGIGVSNDYEGHIYIDTWHRVVFAVDSYSDPNSPLEPTVEKYIDGVHVGSTDLDGLDGRWTLYTENDGLPTLLFADEDGDTAPVYVNSFQIRDYTMSPTEVAALGGASASGIPIGTGVAGSWDFNNPSNGYAATVGNDLEFFNQFTFGCIDPNCPLDLESATEFGLTTDYPEVADLPDGPAGVMHFAGPLPCQGYNFPHGAQPNGDPNAIFVNDYTLITDVFYPYDDFYNPPEGYDPEWMPIYQTLEMNDGDAMLWIYTADPTDPNYPHGWLGDDGHYDDTAGWAQADTWMRIVCAVEGSNPIGTQVTKYVLYADDSYVGPVTQGEGVDDQSAEIEFDTCSNLGIPLMPDGDGGVMKFPAFNPDNGFELWHGVSANGGGWYVNQYTLIFDLLIPSDQYGQWMGLWQTNYCNWNNAEFFIDPSGGIGTEGDYDGTLLPDTWYRVVLSVDSSGTNSVQKYVNGTWVGSTTLDGPDGYWTLYTLEDGVPTMMLCDENGETAGGCLNSFQFRDYAMSSSEVAAMGGVSSAGIPLGTGVAGSWDFNDPGNGLVATVGNDLEVWDPMEFGCRDVEGIDTKRAMRTAAEVGDDMLLMFTDGSGDSTYAYTHPGFVSSIQIRDYVMTESEILALGGPRAAGIPYDVCIGDIDGDGDTDLSDLAALLGSYGRTVGDPLFNPAADLDSDGDVDLSDLAELLGHYGCGT